MNEPKSFGSALRDLYEGRIDFTRFAQSTSAKWKRLAIYIETRWKQPTWHPTEDIVQELLIGAWKALSKYDPTRGVPLERYVIYNAVDRAKKRCHRARGALMSGSADRNESRMDHPLSSYDEETQHFILELLQEEPRQLLRLERIEAIERAKQYCQTMIEQSAMASLAHTGSIVMSADLLYQNCHTRLEFRFQSEEHALSNVAKAVAKVAQRIEGEVT